MAHAVRRFKIDPIPYGCKVMGASNCQECWNGLSLDNGSGKCIGRLPFTHVGTGSFVGSSNLVSATSNIVVGSSGKYVVQHYLLILSADYLMHFNNEGTMYKMYFAASDYWREDIRF